MPSLIDLSPEILQLILGQLCLHCQMPHDSPVNCLDSPLAHDGQATLALVCGVHSTLRNVAQPILHHYFFFNAATQHFRLKTLRKRIAVLFGTFCKRPDLAEAMRVLSLSAPATPADMGKFPIESESWKAYPRLEHFRDTELGAHLDLRHANARPVDYTVMCHVLLSVIPNLRKLQCQILITQSFLDDQEPLKTIKRLEVNQPTGLSLPAYPHANIFKVFPVIESLDMTSSLSCPHHYDSHDPAAKVCGHRVWEMLPKTLRKITFDHLNITSLGRIFDHLDKLEDLSISIYINVNWAWELVTPPNGAFEALRGTLKRLVVTRPRPSQPNETGLLPDGIYLKPALSLRKLEILETLEIEHTFLTGEILRSQSGDGSRLSMVLPETLRTLRIGYIWDWAELEKQLQDLVNAKQTDHFPTLTAVLVEFAEPNSAMEDKTSAMVTAFNEAGVTLTIGYSRSVGEFGNRGMLTQLPGAPLLR